MGRHRGPTFLKALRRLWRRGRQAWRDLRRRLLWAAHDALAGIRRPDVIFLGDSLTFEWLERDPARFLGRRRVNMGIGGETSLDMLARFDRDVIARRPRAVHIMAGTNDLWHGRPGEGAADAISRIGEMVERAQAAGIVPVLAPPPPIDPGIAHLFGRADLFPALREGVARIGEGVGVVFVDYGTMLGDGAGGVRRACTTDGVHLSREGYRAMRPLVERALAEAVSADDLPASPRLQG